jgi:nitrate/TMAO reductase-like tetraheme cytochrome c subunit
MQIMRRRREKLFFLMFAGAIGIGLLVIGGFQLLEFTDSASFCGRLCHNVMNPEYTTYQNSPHSRVACASCHVGPGASYLVKSKISGVPMIWATITGRFDKPIPTPVKNLRPARDTCEQCHRPERFAGDLVRTHTTYLTDEKNTAQTDTRILRVGGGAQEAPQGIHWHVASNVWYVSLDEQRQTIAWVGIEGANGTYTAQFTNPAIPVVLTLEQIKDERRQMDCIDCHNRATHQFQPPEAIIAGFMTQGSIDPTLPFINREATNALYPENTSIEVADAKLDAISDFYRVNYPTVFAQKKDSIDMSIAQLKKVADLTTFPGSNVSWGSYKDNATHEGCFRCHGTLVSAGGTSGGVTLDASCTLCHYQIAPP